MSTPHRVRRTTIKSPSLPVPVPEVENHYSLIQRLTEAAQTSKSHFALLWIDSGNSRGEAIESRVDIKTGGGNGIEKYGSKIFKSRLNTWFTDEVMAEAQDLIRDSKGDGDNSRARKKPRLDSDKTVDSLHHRNDPVTVDEEIDELMSDSDLDQPNSLVQSIISDPPTSNTNRLQPRSVEAASASLLTDDVRMIPADHQSHNESESDSLDRNAKGNRNRRRGKRIGPPLSSNLGPGQPLVNTYGTRSTTADASRSYLPSPLQMLGSAIVLRPPSAASHQYQHPDTPSIISSYHCDPSHPLSPASTLQRIHQPIPTDHLTFRHSPQTINVDPSFASPSMIISTSRLLHLSPSQPAERRTVWNERDLTHSLASEILSPQPSARMVHSPIVDQLEQQSLQLHQEQHRLWKQHIHNPTAASPSQWQHYLKEKDGIRLGSPKIGSDCHPFNPVESPAPETFNDGFAANYHDDCNLMPFHEYDGFTRYTSGFEDEMFGITS
jgi:hypothetical protein